ncbi:MAG: hypothetical protein AB7O28_01485 [Vicinamibacterales bacterium]
MGIVNMSGRLSLLRVHERGSKFGPPSDQIDAEVVIGFQNRPSDFFGFQLRQDANAPVREGMLGLLRDGFNHNWIVNVDFDQKPNRRNSILLRVWLTKPPSGLGGVIGDVIGGVITRAARSTTGSAKRPRTRKAAKKSPGGRRRP